MDCIVASHGQQCRKSSKVLLFFFVFAYLSQISFVRYFAVKEKDEIVEFHKGAEICIEFCAAFGLFLVENI